MADRALPTIMRFGNETLAARLPTSGMKVRGSFLDDGNCNLPASEGFVDFCNFAAQHQRKDVL